MPNLDGTEKLSYTPFDAHERVARVPHKEADNLPGYAHSGLVATDPDAPPAEFPKAVDVQDNQNEPVVVADRTEELAYLQAKVAALEAENSALEAEIEYLKAQADAQQKEQTALESANAAAEQAAQVEGKFASITPPEDK